MTQQTKAIQKDIQATKDRQKCYAYPKISECEFEVGDKLLLQVRQKEALILLENIRS